MKKPPLKKSRKVGNLDSSFKYEGPPPIKGKTITRHSTMAGYGAHDERMPSPRGKGSFKITGKRNRYD